MPSTPTDLPHRTSRAAQLRREAAGRERRRLLLGVAAVVAVLAVVAGVVVLSGRGEETPPPSAVPARAEGGALVLGREDAAHTVVVYEDFLCPYCREFENGSRDFLRADAATGSVQVEYRPFHLLQDDYSERALNAWGLVLADGTPEQAAAFHDKLYDEQPYEASASKPDDAQLAAWAKDSGVQDEALLRRISEGEIDQQLVDAADAKAEQAGVTGTPTVLLDGEPLEGSSISDMVDSLERTLAGS
ncbi:DsbA family protein [Nocardioides aurantiacus]|uniref:Protein-disulfide isomerase n=1 Tax=Nocardioides aurantiacus TaxID=86796 RepID=A0A3N2CW68_9ACTN|nr:thioredoxin domain-containing protein [Nocardioides aurantiacus]ROR91706.1 protein-disulfide isomerase [Nocardioides aurantiacus]